MPIIDPALIQQARDAIEKQAVIIPTLIGAGLGLGMAPRRNKLRGTMRGAGVGLTTGIGMPVGGALGALGGGLLGAGAGGLLGAGAGLFGAGGGDIPNMAAGGATLGGGLGAIGGVVGGTALGGMRGYQLGRRHIWDQPWADDRELPHGVSGVVEDEDEDEGAQKKAASFAHRLGALAARTRM
jgi:hypothetical protein